MNEVFKKTFLVLGGMWSTTFYLWRRWKI